MALLPIQFAFGLALSPQQIIDRIREHVVTQLKKSANYSCVLTVDRDYFVAPRKRGCFPPGEADAKEHFMHDRLRLDVAVSGGEEIFSWHGGKVFSSRGIGDVVRSGPISSGSFVGYLQNIFFKHGVHVYYQLSGANDGRFHFTYDVPLSASEHAVALGERRTLTPFHGEFAADTQTYELVMLKAIVDHAPKRSGLCLAKSEVEYQTVSISGSDSRIPGGFRLETQDENGFSTTSLSKYQACKAFAGESTVSFDDAPGNPAARSRPAEEAVLPPGLRLSIAMQSPIDDLHSFTGDPVEGVLTRDVQVPKKNVILPRGAIVSGVIVRFETHYRPERYYIVRIRFDRITFGSSSYSTQALPADTSETSQKLRALYGAALSDPANEDLRHGILLGTDSHFRLSDRTARDWITEPVYPGESTNR